VGVIQLELNLWEQLAQAQQSPQATDWQQLCLAFDLTIDQTPPSQRLAAAADAIEQMAEVFAARAEEIFNAWLRQQRANQGPVLDEDLFAEFVRQSFHLDLDDLVGEPTRYMRSSTQQFHPEDESVIGYRNKDEVLSELEPLAERERAIAELEYDEYVGAWIAVVREWLTGQEGDQASFTELLKGTGLSVVKVWLALLLGGFELRQGNEFYEVDELVVAN
jgi:hypothetical protein